MVAPIVAASLVSGASSLLGGLFGKKDKETTNRVNYQQMRDDALAAGFNPLTALRNGGSANATTTTPGLSSGEVLANAVQAGLGTYLSHDPVAEETRRLQNEIVKEELHQLRSAPRGFLSVPAVASTQSPVAVQTAVSPNDELTTGYAPRRSVFDDRADMETLIGVEMPWDAADRNEAAGGDIFGGLETARDLGVRSAYKAAAMRYENTGDYIRYMDQDGYWRNQLRPRYVPPGGRDRPIPRFIAPNPATVGPEDFWQRRKRGDTPFTWQ